ncbi:hypothetical protein [Microbacterium sp.]|uniref:hypothetical protein n=1 Tax=Microbacterium sp. TaxID=51671 RepID=UPI003A86D534
MCERAYARMGQQAVETCIRANAGDGLLPEDPEPTEPTEPGIPAVTLTDLARFAPEQSRTVLEPDGIGVVGLPANLLAPSSAHTVAGELFGQPASVRFTPEEYVFVHGDDTFQVTRTAGRTWADLGVPQFTATDTSHTYSTRGTYTVHTIVRYAAEVDLGSGWMPVAGLLDIPTPETSVQVYELHTALVEHTCDEDPTGPGC